MSNREVYEMVAKLASNFYFTILELVNLDPMY